MRWPDSARALAAAAGWVWLLLPLAAEASRAHVALATTTGMPAAMGEFVVMADLPPSSWATDCPPCISCYRAPAPAAKPVAESDWTPDPSAGVHLLDPQIPTDGWHVLAPMVPVVPLRIVLCRWRE